MDNYNKKITLAIPIGVMIVAKGDINYHGCSVRLFSESGCDEGAYYPSQDIHIYGTKQVEDLRDFCSTVLGSLAELHEKKNEA